MIYITQNNKQTTTTIKLMSREACREGFERFTIWFDKKAQSKYFVS